MPIADIWYAVGFNDVPSYNCMFKKQTEKHPKIIGPGIYWKNRRIKSAARNLSSSGGSDRRAGGGYYRNS